jgi:hypothetical protein
MSNHLRAAGIKCYIDCSSAVRSQRSDGSYPRWFLGELGSDGWTVYTAVNGMSVTVEIKRGSSSSVISGLSIEETGSIIRGRVGEPDATVTVSKAGGLGDKVMLAVTGTMFFRNWIGPWLWLVRLTLSYQAGLSDLGQIS